MSVNRRDFVKLSAAGIAATVLGTPLRLSATALRAEITPLRRNVGIFTSRGGTIGWLINGDGVVVVDSQFADTAPELLAAVRERSPRRIDLLVNTHHHPDHIGGNLVLRPSVQTIVAHARSAENQRQVARQRGNEVEHAFPDVTFTNSWSATIGDETIRVKHFGAAHTGGDAAIHFERANVVHLGDLLNNRGYPNIDVPAGASIHSWIGVLETIAAEHSADTIYIFGHNEAGYPPSGSRDDLFYQRDYFNALLETAAAALRQGRSREETIAIAPLPGFEGLGGTQSRLGLGLGIAYDELSARR